jgi:hypothetical protein
MTHSDLEAALRSHARASSAAAHDFREAAEKGRAAKRRDLEMNVGISAENELRLSMTHDHTINEHVRQAKVQARRAEFASRGYLLDSPDEADHEHQTRNGDLIHGARKAGLIHYSEERSSCDCDD